MIHLNPLHSGMDCSCTQTCHEIKYQELLRSPDSFKHGSEDIEGVHVEEQMPEASVHEHVSHRLPPVEERRSRIEEGECLIHEILSQSRHDHDEDIDYDYVLDSRGHIAHEAATAAVVVVVVIVAHFLFIFISPALRSAT